MLAAKFQGYQYGGRPLGLAFNARYKDFATNESGGQDAENGIQVEPANGGDMAEASKTEFPEGERDAEVA